MFKRFSPLYCPMFFLYLLAGLLIFFFADYERAWNHMVPSVLSRYMPVPESWRDFNRDRHKFDIKRIKEFERYYQKVSQFMPFLPEASAMLGFCYFYDNQIVKAEKSYQKAIDGYPRVFNFHYNLGIILLKQNNFLKALDHFKKSVAVSPIENIRYIVNARIYQPFLPFMHQPQALALSMGQYTQEFYRQAYLQILQICEQQKDYKTMLIYARSAIVSGVLEKPTAYFYAGRGAYQLKEYENATVYLQQALEEGFYFAQTFEMLGVCLQVLHRPQSTAALFSAGRLIKDGKVFKPEKLKLDLLIY